MRLTSSQKVVVPFLLTMAVSFIWCPNLLGFPQYSEAGNATYCRECHGNFRATQYISLTDGTAWGNLHNLHRYTMLNGDCQTCHGSGPFFPVMIRSSAGGSGLSPLSCTGCHGREEDDTPANPDWGSMSGLGAGLRQHHYSAGVMVCAGCHSDADPANYVPVGENILPPYYANPGTNHPAMPTDPCNPSGGEDFAGIPEGLDNDGDDLYDGDDLNCPSTGVRDTPDDLVFLLQNSPNPFNPMTVIRYSLPRTGLARLCVYSASGRLVRVLAEGLHEVGVHYEVPWDGRNEEARLLSSGVYFCRLESGDFVQTRRMTMIR